MDKNPIRRNVIQISNINTNADIFINTRTDIKIQNWHTKKKIQYAG